MRSCPSSRKCGGTWKPSSTRSRRQTAGDIAGTIACVEEGIKIRGEAGLHFDTYSHFLLMAYLVAGDFDRAERLAEEIYAMQESIVFYFRMDALAWIARVKIARGELGQAQRILEGIYPGRDLDRSSNFVVASLLVAEAYLNLASGKPERALERMVYLVGRLRQAGVRARFAEALWLQGKAWADLGERGQAQQAFVEAQAVAEATQARRMLWQILASLAEIKELQGNLNRA